MTFVFRIPSEQFDLMRADLARPHRFAHERVGFLTAGVVGARGSELVLLARDYRGVEDEDYVADPTVGARVGPEAMRKALQGAYRFRSALFHVHSHGGHGQPDFSSVDIRESNQFAPSFFNIVPQMPHGVLVLSDDAARGRMWINPKHAALSLVSFVQVGPRSRARGVAA